MSIFPGKTDLYKHQEYIFCKSVNSFYFVNNQKDYLHEVLFRFSVEIGI